MRGSLGAAGYSAPVNATVDRFVGGTHDATTSIGPGTVDLLTGNFTVSRTDVSIPGFGSALEFSRTHSSRDVDVVGTGVLGQGWRPGVQVEAAGGAAWRSVRKVIASAEEKKKGYLTTRCSPTSKVTNTPSKSAKGNTSRLQRQAAGC